MAFTLGGFVNVSYTAPVIQFFSLSGYKFCLLLCQILQYFVIRPSTMACEQTKKSYIYVFFNLVAGKTDWITRDNSLIAYRSQV